MALVESVQLPAGTVMPEFELKDTDGKTVRGTELAGPKGLLLVFTCNHCPYAIAVWPRLIALAKEAEKIGVATAAVNPNINPNYPDDSPANMRVKIREWNIPFPYLVDETQNVAREFKAQCTPDLYLFDASRKLVYHGRFDDNWKEESKVRTRDLRDAIHNMAAGRPVAAQQFPSMGCSIKWRT